MMSSNSGRPSTHSATAVGRNRTPSGNASCGRHRLLAQRVVLGGAGAVSVGGSVMQLMHSLQLRTERVFVDSEAGLRGAHSKDALDHWARIPVGQLDCETRVFIEVHLVTGGDFIAAGHRVAYVGIGAVVDVATQFQGELCE